MASNDHEVDMSIIGGVTIDIAIPSPETLIQVRYNDRIYYTDIINSLNNDELATMMSTYNFRGNYSRDVSINMLRKVIRGLDSGKDVSNNNSVIIVGVALLFCAIIVLAVLVSYVSALYFGSA